MSGPRVEITELGDWGGRAPLAEYDPEGDVIRIDARAAAMVRAASGSGEMQRFFAAAIAHERFHRDHPAASEADAHAHVAACFGGDPRRFERFCRR